MLHLYRTVDKCVEALSHLDCRMEHQNWMPGGISQMANCSHATVFSPAELAMGAACLAVPKAAAKVKVQALKGDTLPSLQSLQQAMTQSLVEGLKLLMTAVASLG